MGLHGIYTSGLAHISKIVEFTTKHKNALLLSLASLIVGGIVMILSSVFWVNFNQVYKHTESYDITLGEVIAASGQTLGQMGFLLSLFYTGKVLRDFFKPMQVLYVFAFFFFVLGVYDLIDIFFINPFEVSVPKFLGFVVAVIITILRLTWTTTN